MAAFHHQAGAQYRLPHLWLPLQFLGIRQTCPIRRRGPKTESQRAVAAAVEAALRVLGLRRRWSTCSRNPAGRRSTGPTPTLSAARHALAIFPPLVIPTPALIAVHVSLGGQRGWALLFSQRFEILKLPLQPLP